VHVLATEKTATAFGAPDTILGILVTPDDIPLLVTLIMPRLQRNYYCPQYY